MRRIAAFVSLLVVAAGVRSQGEGSSFLTTASGIATTATTDYQAIGINPANLGLQLDWNTSLGLFEVGGSLYSDALVKSDLREILLDFSEISLTEVQEEIFSEAFVENGESIDLDAMVVGMGFAVGDRGGLAFDIRSNGSAYFKLNDFASSLLFQGFDFDEYFDEVVVLFGDTTGVSSTPEKLSTLFEGTRLNMLATAEVNLAYGHRWDANPVRSVMAGVGARYVMGLGIFDFRVEQDELKGFSSLAPGLIFELDSLVSPSALSADEGFRPVGHGAGFDLGVTVQEDGITYGAALTDLGFIRWTGNVVSWNDYLLDSLAFSGINTFNIVDRLDEFIAEQVFETEGEEARTSVLPAKFRTGIHYRFSDDLDAGVDVIIPLNKAPGNLVHPYVSAGAEWCFVTVFHLSGGVAVGGNYDFRIPLGLSVRAPKWEGGIATRDALTWFGQKKPTLSAAAGFLRFKFGG